MQAELVFFAKRAAPRNAYRSHLLLLSCSAKVLYLASPRYACWTLLERAVRNKVPPSFTLADIFQPALAMPIAHVGADRLDNADPAAQQ